jgi:hypothetical protein
MFEEFLFPKCVKERRALRRGVFVALLSALCDSNIDLFLHPKAILVTHPRITWISDIELEVSQKLGEGS